MSALKAINDPAALPALADFVRTYHADLGGAPAVAPLPIDPPAEAPNPGEEAPLIDDRPVGSLKSPGIAHPTKSKVEFGCMGKDGFFDDLKIWSAEAVR